MNDNLSTALPNIDAAQLNPIEASVLAGPGDPTHPPRILIGRMKPSSYYQRVVDVCEELTKFTWLVRGRSVYLTDRYSERVECAEDLSKRVNQRSI